jgi:hypothetical protein
MGSTSPVFHVEQPRLARPRKLAAQFLVDLLDAAQRKVLAGRNPTR